MIISTKGRYALRFMIDLAGHAENACVNLKEIAVRQGISPKYLEQIVLHLCQADLVLSVRGAHGGYCLTRPANKYTVAEILEVTERSLAAVACLHGSENSCPNCDMCPTLPFWEKLDKLIWKYLRSTTLDKLVRRGSNCRRRASAQSKPREKRPKKASSADSQA